MRLAAAQLARARAADTLPNRVVDRVVKREPGALTLSEDDREWCACWPSSAGD
jgi:hypothetical protein